jgi:beta-lactamase regulating signal transducer with metallopeptidase domain
MMERIALSVMCALVVCAIASSVMRRLSSWLTRRLPGSPTDAYRVLAGVVIALAALAVLGAFRFYAGAETTAARVLSSRLPDGVVLPEPVLTVGSVVSLVIVATVLVWAAVCVRNLVRVMLCVRETRHLVASASDASQAIVSVVDRVAQRMNVRRPRVLVSARITVPAVAGVVSPVLLLPADVDAIMTNAQLDLVIAHELAHIDRRDTAINLLQTIVEALFFFSPDLRMLSAEVRAQRELAADARAADAFGAPLVLARALERLETVRSARHTRLALAADDEPLLRRIIALASYTHQAQHIALKRQPLARALAIRLAPAALLLACAAINVAAVPAGIVDDLIRLKTPAAAFRQNIHATDDAGPFTLAVVGYRAVGATIAGKPVPPTHIRQRGDEVRFVADDGSTLLAVTLRPAGGMVWRSR